DDGNACTRTDTCRDGACTGANPVACPAKDQCHAPGSCNPATGACVEVPKPNGSACDDGNACTRSDSCVDGACVGSSPVSCPSANDCNEAGTCDPATGRCTQARRPDGTPCDDGNGCTRSDSCRGGVCEGGAPVSCPDPGACEEQAVCAPATGGCAARPRADGTPCSNGACQGGRCVAADEAPPVGSTGCGCGAAGADAGAALLPVGSLLLAAFRRRRRAR
ncbi:MAG: MYXO-CTERM sorting domain-containing protein, partial [Myxococcales bacterium]